jgi:hypothetical protein
MRSAILCLSVVFAAFVRGFGQDAGQGPPKAVFVQQPGFYGPEGLDLELRAEPADARLYYTLDGSIPDREARLYSGPIPILETTVVRIFARSGKKVGEVQTGTFFVGEKTELPVVSLSVAPHLLFHPETGLFVKGPRASESYPFQGANFWSRRELPAHVEFFEEDDRQVLSENVGMSAFGGMSRVFPQKSIALTARKRYGAKNLKHAFFSDRPFRKYKHLVLRNSGSDFGKTHFRDALITSLGAEMGLEVQAYRPAVVFVNGAYWGLLNLREKINRHFVANHFGVPRDSLDLIERRGDVKFGSLAAYNRFRSFLASPATDLSDPAQYARAAAQMDTDNFLNYQVLQIYADNQDCGGNIKFWRPWRPNGRWSWLLYDTDFGFGLYEEKAYQNNSLASQTEPDGPVWPNPSWSTLFLRKMLENPGFRDRFANRFMDCINTVFRPEHIVARADSFQRRLEPEMARHLSHWKRGDMQGWYRNIERMKTFARERPAHMIGFLRARWDLGRTAPVQVRVQGRGTVRINGFVAVRDSFEGLYFEKLPISVEARPGFGHRFAGWKSLPAGDPSQAVLTLAPGNGIALCAVFERLQGPHENRIVINEIGFLEDRAGAWVELYNLGRRNVSLRDWTLALDEKQVLRIPAGFLPSQGFALLCSDTAAFRRAHPDCAAVLVAMPGLSPNPFRQALQLLDDSGASVDSTGYRIEPHEGDSFLELLRPDADNGIFANWRYAEGSGSPGRHNPEAARVLDQRKAQQRWISLAAIVAVALVVWGTRRLASETDPDT